MGSPGLWKEVNDAVRQITLALPGRVKPGTVEPACVTVVPGMRSGATPFRAITSVWKEDEYG